MKKDDEFVEELEMFHFGEMPFHRNDSHGKVAEHCKENNVHFEYTHHWDREESVFCSALNLTALRRRFKKKITTKGGKGDEQAKAEEEAKRRNEEAQRLAQEAAGWLEKKKRKEKLCKRQLEKQRKKK